MTGEWGHDESEDIHDIIRWEISCLWDDMFWAQRRAIRNESSLETDRLIQRIRKLTLFVGQAPWETIQISLLKNGTYKRVYETLDRPIEWDRVNAIARKYMPEANS